jgi:hypothetical protein
MLKRTYALPVNVRIELKQYDCHNRLRKVNVSVHSNLLNPWRPEWKAFLLILKTFNSSGEVSKMDLAHLKQVHNTDYNGFLHGDYQKLYDTPVDAEFKLVYREILDVFDDKFCIEDQS